MLWPGGCPRPAEPQEEGTKYGKRGRKTQSRGGRKAAGAHCAQVPIGRGAAPAWGETQGHLMQPASKYLERVFVQLDGSAHLAHEFLRE